MNKNTMFRDSHLLLLLSVILYSCGPTAEQESLRESMTFYSSFDGTGDADFANGDKSIYTSPTRNGLDKSEKGITHEDYILTSGGGLSGNAINFSKKGQPVMFYKGKNNIAYDASNFSGTVSFWLNFDPNTDLEPGYTDPFQITAKDYNDAALWVDFTDKNPRHMRLGVFGDLVSWNPDTLSSSETPEFDKRLIWARDPAFKKGQWTHIAFTYSALGSDNGEYTLYMDGVVIGKISGIKDSFTWNVDNSTIMIGINFVGLMDDLSIYNSALTDQEIGELYQLAGNLKSIL